MTQVLGQPLHLVAWWSGGALAVMAVILSTFQIFLHLKHFHSPGTQLYIVRIILMVPIYAIDSWLSLRFHEASIYLDSIRNCYEAYVIWSFVRLMMSYLAEDGGETYNLGSNRRPVPHLFPMNLCLRPVPMGQNFFLRCRKGTFQYVLIKPVTTAIALVLEWNHLLDDGHFRPKRGFVYLSVVEMASVTVAMYWLVMFFQATKSRLAPHRPGLKFLCVKAVVFFCFWQGILIALLRKLNVIHDTTDFTATNMATGMQDFLVCVEMFLASLAHIWAFPHNDFADSQKERPKLGKTISHAFSIKDVLAETKTLWKPLPSRDGEHDSEKGHPLLELNPKGPAQDQEK